MNECQANEARVTDKTLTVQINAFMLASKLGHPDCEVTAAVVNGGQIAFTLKMRKP